MPDFFHYLSYNTRGNRWHSYWIPSPGWTQGLPRALVKARKQSLIMLRYLASHCLEAPIIEQYWKKAHRSIHKDKFGAFIYGMPWFQETKFPWTFPWTTNQTDQNLQGWFHLHKLPQLAKLISCDKTCCKGHEWTLHRERMFHIWTGVTLAWAAAH